MIADEEKIVSRKTPYETARKYIADAHMSGRKVTLRYWDGEWWEWQQGFKKEPESFVAGGVANFLEGCCRVNKDGVVVEFNPRPKHVAEVVEAIKHQWSVAQVPDDAEFARP